MTKYPLAAEFKRFSRLRPPLTEALLPPANFALSIAAVFAAHGDRSVKAKKIYIDTPDGYRLPARIFSFAGIKSGAPCLVYYHGGGFVFKAAPCHFAAARDYARAIRGTVLAVDYRLAPKYRYPLPLDDCVTAFNWAVDNAVMLKTASGCIAVGGDSAGGCLAAGVAMKAAFGGGVRPCALMAIYPVADRGMQTASMRDFTDTPMWNSVLNRRMWEWYLKKDEADAFTSPLDGDLRLMPPAYIETAQYDCLHDEGAAFAAALRKAGTATELNETAGTMHGYDCLRSSDTLKACMVKRIAFLLKNFPVEPGLSR